MKLPLILAALSLLTPLARAQNSADLEQIIRQRVAAGKTPGLVVGVIDAHGSNFFAAGKMDKNGADVNEDTIFEIGSETKVFTGLLLADAVARGEVKLADPITAYLPSSVKAPSRNGKQITLLDLVTQSSGLPRMPGNFSPRDPENPYVDYTFDRLCAFLSSYTLPRDPGDSYEYSNLGFGLLGSLLARHSGLGYEALLKARVLDPLGLHDTAITLSASQKERFAAGHDAAQQPAHAWDFDAFAGAGAIRSTARDMLKFLAANMHLTDTLLWPAMGSMQQPLRSAGQPAMRIGLAWHITDKFDKRVIWHNGQTGGYHSFMGFDPTNKIGIVLLANTGDSFDDIGFNFLAPPKAPVASTPPETHPIVPVPTAQLDKYVGQYQLTPDAEFSLHLEGNRLLAQLTGQDAYEIYPSSQNDFFYKIVNAQITFNLDLADKVISLTLHQNGLDQVARKVSDTPEKQRVAATISPAIYDAYVGEYQLAPGAVFTLRRDGDHLLAKLTGQAFYEIFPENETNFFYKVVDAQISFLKGADGKATALILHQNGADQRAVKTK